MNKYNELKISNKKIQKNMEEHINRPYIRKDTLFQ